MKEIQDIIRAYDQLDFTNVNTAMATVVHVDGSSYRRSGARMLVQDNGNWTGGISGGCLEGDALKKANFAMSTKKASVVTYDTTKDDGKQIGVGLGCNGIIDVLLHPIDPEDPNNPIEVLRLCSNERKVNIVLTIISVSGGTEIKAGDMIKFEGYDTINKYFDFRENTGLLADIDKTFETRKSTVKDCGDLKVFIEVLLPPVKIVLFGGFYDVLPLLKIGHELGWITNVVINPANAGKAISEHADTIIPKGEPVEVDDFTVFILMAHDFKTDKANLKLAFGTSVPYIGMLGPFKRRNNALDELQEEGMVITGADLDRLHNPVGLDIGATTPEEIAISIIAEIRSFFSQRSGGYLKNRVGTIHERA